MILLTAFGITSPLYAHVLNIDPKSVEAEAWIVLDPQSDQIIASHNKDQIRAPASLTKMMVGYLTLKAIENNKISLDQVITVPEIVNTVAGDESKLRLKPNEQITVRDLLTSLIVMSANDSALTLGSLIANDMPSFIQLMNQTAKDIGMLNTHFSNASGITMENHFTTAFDLSLLTEKIISSTPHYLGYSKQQFFTYKGITHKATNILLEKDPTIDGFKTGYTAAAGYNLALTANRIDQNTQQQRRLLVIVMGATSKFKRAEIAEKLINIGFTYTQTKQLFNQDYVIAKLPVKNGTLMNYDVNLPVSNSYNTVNLLASPTLLDLKKFDLENRKFVLDSTHNTFLEPLQEPQNIKYEIQLNSELLTAPLTLNDFSVAQIKVSQFEEPLHSIDVNINLELEEASIWQKFMNWIKSWFISADELIGKPVIYQIPSKY